MHRVWNWPSWFENPQLQKNSSMLLILAWNSRVNYQGTVIYNHVYCVLSNAGMYMTSLLSYLYRSMGDGTWQCTWLMLKLQMQTDESGKKSENHMSKIRSEKILIYLDTCANRVSCFLVKTSSWPYSISCITFLYVYYRLLLELVL